MLKTGTISAALFAVAATIVMAPQAAHAAAKCRTGDAITTIGNRILCVSRNKTPKCGRAKYVVDYQGTKDKCVVYRRNGSVKKVTATKCGFLGTGAGWQFTRGKDKCLYNPNAFRR